MLYLVHDEETLRARKGCIRGMNAIDQTEFMIIVAKESLDDIPSRPRKYFGGTNQGNVLINLKVPTCDELWKLPPQIRGQVLGEYLKPCGGPTPGEAPGRGKKVPPKELEPVFWHAMHPEFYAELVLGAETA